MSGEIAAGRSYYDDCTEALDELRVALDIEQWAILSYSTGTRVGEAYMQRYPQHVTQAAFLCPLYLHRSWRLALQIEEWIDVRRSALADWILSGWRLHGMLLALGFNWRHFSCAGAWMREIKLQSVGNLKRMLLELPDKGRAPFVLPSTSAASTLFIWGLSDALTARPRHLRSNEVCIWANHGAPMLVPDKIARIVLPFFNNEFGRDCRLVERESRAKSLFKLPRYGKAARKTPERLPV